jgi:hypothetical protein
LLHLYFIIIY